ncbi:hypothetical protein BC939DRAFT_439408 [Gamsiella multidivaricata]|uniref:uncharacterized protein n=1 Tax=Gamsiella multidivaricata TaxID=101098 RepID=UPI00221EC4DF|nr:uncharacterized protein BC939DRAFT_439408 [Gamsiella multidivaricata]KAI7830459.1 hypothetical protein BC939DRAFT_439408 [Gamsiella multidivaricata]
MVPIYSRNLLSILVLALLLLLLLLFKPTLPPHGYECCYRVVRSRAINFPLSTGRARPGVGLGTFTCPVTWHSILGHKSKALWNSALRCFERTSRMRPALTFTLCMRDEGFFVSPRPTHLGIVQSRRCNSLSPGNRQARAQTRDRLRDRT